MVIDTPLGQMIAISDEENLRFLEFADAARVESEMMRIGEKLGATITFAKAAPLESINRELKAYFDGALREFKTPYLLDGTFFQQSVWTTLSHIPYGETRSYAQVAQSLDKPTAFRAVANANGANKLTIVVPCHRVIATGGGLGGYGAGLQRKEWLLSHEGK